MTLAVRVYDDKHAGKRVVVDFEEEQTSDRFLLLTPQGGSIRLGMERLDLDWGNLVELSELIKTGAKTLRLK
jgi:hypothetical protein